MNVIRSFNLLIEDFKKQKVLRVKPVRKYVTSKNYIYVLELRDIEKKRKQMLKGLGRTHAWIYIYDIDIAQALNVKPKDFYDFLKSIGYKQDKYTDSHFMETEEEALATLDKIYEYSFKYTHKRRRLNEHNKIA